MLDVEVIDLPFSEPSEVVRFQELVRVEDLDVAAAALSASRISESVGTFRKWLRAICAKRLSSPGAKMNLHWLFMTCAKLTMR